MRCPEEQRGISAPSEFQNTSALGCSSSLCFHCHCFVIIMGQQLPTVKHCALSMAQVKPGFAVTCTNKLSNQRAGKTKHFGIAEIYTVVAKLLASLF